MLSYMKFIIFIFFAAITFVNNGYTANGKGPLEIDNDDITTHTRMTADATGQYVYNIHVTNDGSNDIVQIERSSDYGTSWENPTTVTGDSGASNLSKSGQNARHPQIATNSTGQYVYAIWERLERYTYIIQVALSSDYGDNWENPTITPGEEIPNLSDKQRPSSEAQISTDSTGQYVYAIWQSDNGIEPIVQVAISSNYGAKWKCINTGGNFIFLD